MKRRGRFWRVYYRLMMRGYCDSPGGMEYRRVKREWRAAGRPRPIADFIKRAANRGPVRVEGPEGGPS